MNPSHLEPLVVDAVHPEIILFALLITGAAIGLFTGRILHRLRLLPVASIGNLSSIAVAHSTDLIWIEVKDQTVWQNDQSKRFMGELAAGASGLDCFRFDSGRFVAGKSGRAQISVLGKDRYYDVMTKQVDVLSIYYAKDAESTIQAERELQRFMQTLTDTFAHLPVGLAIFNYQRELALFNPALAEQFRLSPEWLARRPTLRLFLDRLRNDGMLPEPKNFKSWRAQIEFLERTAESGGYQEDWHLPTGQVFRVNARPHPRNSVAFLFEDISNTVAVEREYRAELGNMHNALDALGVAVAIFDSTGQMTFANHAFAEMWDFDAAGRLAPVDAMEITRLWQSRCDPTPVWGDFRDFAVEFGDRSEWSATVKLKDGPFLNASFVPLSGGQILCEFTPFQPAAEFAAPASKQIA